MAENTGFAEPAPDDLKVLERLLTEQRVGVLASFDGLCPYANIVAFAAAGDLGELFFASPRASRKSENLLRLPKAAFLVDDRSGAEKDFAAAAAVTATGDIRVLSMEERPGPLDLYTAKHPSLAGFVRSPDTLFLALSVSSYILVRNFSHTREIRPPVGTGP